MSYSDERLLEVVLEFSTLDKMVVILGVELLRVHSEPRCDSCSTPDLACSS